MEKLFKKITDLAEIPSFSSFENKIHPYIIQMARVIKDCKVYKIPDHNLILEIPGNKDTTPIALAAHLDKINHFGEDAPDKLPVKKGPTYFEGLLDDAVGLGIILQIASEWEYNNFPPLFLLLSEMEESMGLKKHPELLRNRGEGLHHGMGAERIADFLISRDIDIAAVITVDTTPLFRGENGVALYGKHWEFTEQEPSDEEKNETQKLIRTITEIDPDILVSNNTNDYLHYGKKLNAQKTGRVVPSIALEPAICPYHQADERVYFKDIERVYGILKKLLLVYPD